MAKRLDHSPADRLRLALPGGPNPRFSLVDPKSTRKPHMAISQNLRLGFARFELIANLAQDLNQDVLEPHQPGNSPKLVLYNCHMAAAFPQQSQKTIGGKICRDKRERAKEGLNLLKAPFLQVTSHQILRMQHSNNVVN